MTPIAALLPGSDFTIKKKTDSELYLPKWVRTKPEDMLKNNLDQKPNRTLRKRRRQRYNLYNRRGILDDKIMQKLEEAEWLSTLIKRSLTGVLSKKIKLKALRRSVHKGLGEYEIESEEEIEDEQQHFSSKKKVKINKDKFERKQLFRDRLRWEKMNEWNKPPPTDKAENVYSQNFIAYLSQVKLPGRKQNLNELENLYKTYQSIVMPQPKKVRKKRKTRNDKSIRSLKTNSKGNKSMHKIQAIEGAVIKQEETNVVGRSAEYEAYDEQVDIISRARMTLSPANQLKFKTKTISSKENRNITNLQTKNTKDSLLNSQVKNDSETALQLKEKLSLTTVFRRKATLLSLTTIKNKKSSAAANKSPVLPLNNTL